MAYQQVSIELVRDGQCTPWGFRLTGGADIGSPLVVQRITFGSPSDGELQKGDVLLRIRDFNAAQLSHQAATDLIAKAGSLLKMVIARSGVPISSLSGISTPPMRTLLSPTPSEGSSPFLFKPLPTTQFGAQRQRRFSSESYASTTSSDMERDAITSQPYRSTPLILPGAKSNKDTPHGSYLRFDPLTKRSSTPPNAGFRSTDPYMLTKVQEAVLEAAQCSSNISSPGRTPTPDMFNHNGSQAFLRQYNTPIHMYSNQAIVEALAAQTVHTKNPVLNNADVLESKKLTNIAASPTYQLIHDEELRKGKVEEHGPAEEHVYNVAPYGGEHYRPEIQQSGSFKSIMHDLRGVSDF